MTERKPGLPPDVCGARCILAAATFPTRAKFKGMATSLQRDYSGRPSTSEPENRKHAACLRTVMPEGTAEPAPLPGEWQQRPVWSTSQIVPVPVSGNHAVPRRDMYHDCVRQALVRDGWTITHDPLVIPFRRTDLYVDLGAESTLGAEKGGRRVAVEIKSFLGASEILDLEQALGQYRLYRFVLSQREPERSCFLAISRDTYEELFTDAEMLALIAAEDVRLLVFDPLEESIERWVPEWTSAP